MRTNANDTFINSFWRCFVNIPPHSFQDPTSDFFHDAKVSIKQLELLLTVAKWKHIKIAFTGLLMIGLLYIIYFSFSLYNHKGKNEHLQYIPESADATLVLNTREMLSQGIEDLLINSKDESVYNLLMSEYQSQQTKSSLPTGIDYSAHLVVFTLKSEEMVTGILFSLSDPAAFELNMPKVIDPKNEFSKKKGNVGLLLHRLSNKTEQADLVQLADSILGNPTNEVKWDQNDEQLPIAQLRYKELGNDLIVDLSIEDQKMVINGTFTSSKEIVLHHINRLTPEGLHITSTILPEFVKQPENIGLPSSLPLPYALSANVRGSDIVSGSGLPLIPDADVIFYFDEDIPLYLGLLSLAKDGYIKKLTLKSFEYSGFKIYYKQINKNAFYAGRKPYSGSQVLEQSTIFDLQGNLDALTQVKADGMMSRILSLITMYTAGKTFTENTESFNLSMKQTSKNQAKISGELSFKEGKYSTIEFVRLLLSGNFF